MHGADARQTELVSKFSRHLKPIETVIDITATKVNLVARLNFESREG